MEPLILSRDVWFGIYEETRTKNVENENTGVEMMAQSFWGG